MQRHYPAEFHREQGFTEADWLNCLPGAVRDCELLHDRPGQVRVRIGAGTLHLSWQALPPRRIALASLPVLAVRFRFDDRIGEAERHAFMRYFDLYTMRGGG